MDYFLFCNYIAEWSGDVGRIGRFAIHATTAETLTSESVIRPGAGDGLPISGYLIGHCNVDRGWANPSYSIPLSSYHVF